MIYFIMPVTTASLNNQTVNVPQHFTDILQPNGATWTSLPFGLDNGCIVSVSDAATIAQLQSQSDTYSFPTDLTAVLQDSDVTSAVTFLQNLNVPTDQITTGQTFAQVLTAIAQIFLAAQAIAGVTGSAIFTTGVTLDSAVSDSGASTLAPALQASLGAGAGASLGAGSLAGAGAGNSGNAQPVQPAPSSNGPFDFSQIDGTATISDTLTALAQQYTSTIIIGNQPIQAIGEIMGIVLTQLASDNFQYANISPLPSPPWFKETTYGLQVASELCEASTLGGGGQFEVYTGQQLPANQYVSATVATWSAFGYLYLYCRSAGSFLYNYELMVSGYPGYEYSEYIVYAYYGSGTAIMSGYVTLNVGDVWTLVCIGSTISVLQNGTVVNSVTDTTFSSGIYAALGISPPSASLSNLQVSNFSIGSATSGATVSGNCGISGATISWTGTSSGSVISGAGGAYTTSALSNGSYTITPSKTGYTFSPASAAETVSGSNITGVNFTASAVAAVWSQPDDRDYAIFPNNEITVQGTEQYTIPAHPSHTTPVDSRKAKPVDSRKAANIPENSRNNPAGHE